MTWWKNSKYNLTGQTFGRLTVVLKTTTTGKSRWDCRCECGKYTNVSGQNLKSGKVVSCGCALEGCNKKKPYEWLYNQLLSVGLKVGCSLTYEDFCDYTKINKCHYCDTQIVWQEYSHNRKKNTRAYNLDRKDNTKGYTKDNLVVCCASCNRTKGDRFTYEEFLKIAEVIKTFAR